MYLYPYLNQTLKDRLCTDSVSTDVGVGGGAVENLPRLDLLSYLPPSSLTYLLTLETSRKAG